MYEPNGFLSKINSNFSYDYIKDKHFLNEELWGRKYFLDDTQRRNPILDTHY